jgi:signal transduction histidine kinase
MEKLSYGRLPWIDPLLTIIRKPYFVSLRGWDKLIKRPSIKFRTYSGVAGIIRRRMVIAISIALFSGSLSIILGFVLYASRLVNLGEAISVVGLLFVIGLVLNGWIILRLMSNPLKNIEHVEDSLVKMVESGSFKLEYKNSNINYRATPFLQAYNSLLEHVDSIETHNLEFLSKISHEIRSPLASMLGYAELLTDSELRHDDNFIDNCYHILRKEGNLVCRLVEDAVLAAGFDSSHYSFEFAPLRVDQLLTCIIEDERKRNKREIQFNNKIGEVKVVADAISLREAIKNLIDNGIKFSPPESEVQVDLHFATNPDWLEIQIKDFGIGIDEKDRSILFRRFSRIRNKHTVDIPGNGLGLYIANKIIMNHQGEISVNSRLSEGSTFTVSLPLDAPAN